MSTELIIAPPASGKTEACVQRILAYQAQHPLAPIWVLVPDSLQLHAFRRRLAAAGGSIGTKTGYFSTLLNLLVEKKGLSLPLVSLPLIQRIIQETVAEAIQEEELQYYNPLQKFPGFILTLREIFVELKRAYVSPQQFSTFVQDDRPAYRDLALLYERFQARLSKLNLAEQDDINGLALSLLEKDKNLAADIPLLVVDGFVAFNGIQKQALLLLSQQAGQVLITLPGLITADRSAHLAFKKQVDELQASLSPTISTLSNPTFLPEELGHIEKYLFEPVSPVGNARGNLLMLETRSPVDEVREVLRWVKKLVLRKGVNLDDMVIITPNPGLYHPLFKTIASEFGIPLHFSIDDPLNQSPAITALLALLKLPEQNYKARSIINVLRSPYFTSGMEVETIDLLEMISRVAQIIEGKDQWEETWKRLENSSIENKNLLDSERNAPALPRGEEATLLKSRLDAFFDVITPPEGVLSLTEWIVWLEKMLEELLYYKKLESEQEISAYQAFQEVLRAFIASETIMGARLVNFQQFLLDLESTIPKEHYRENEKLNQSKLHIGTIPHARGARFQAVVLLGLSEGLFPAVEHPDPFLDEDFRARLGLESRLQREQASLFYQAVTRADQYLLLTRPYLTDNGEEWEASAFWNAVKHITPDDTRIKVHPDHLQPFEDAGSTQEILFTAVRTAHLPPSMDFLSERWKQLSFAKDIMTARTARVAQGIYEGFPDDISALTQQRYSPDFTWSPSALETYGKCPFMFYVTRALDLSERAIPQLGIDGSQLGSMLHRILELTFRKFSDSQNSDDLLTILEMVCQQKFSTAPQEFGFRPSPLWEIEKEQFLEKLKTSVENLAEDTAWTPIEFEEKFGFTHRAPLIVQYADETIRLHGVIDRVDRNANGDLRVIDYKTGGSFTNNDLTKGYILQIPIYALAARDALQLGEPVAGMYWKILAGEAALRLEKYKTQEMEGLQAAFQVVLEHLVRIVKGVRAAEFPPIPPDGGCPSYCPAAQWCWRYEAGW